MRELVSFWKELRTGCIYKYPVGVKPYNAETAWIQVSIHDYEEQMRRCKK